MPVVPKEIRTVRDAILLQADAISVELEEVCEGGMKCEEYFLLSPEDTSFADVRILVNAAIDVCREEHIRLFFALSFFGLQTDEGFAADELIRVYEAAVKPHELVIERNRLNGDLDVCYEGDEFTPESFQSLLDAFEPFVSEEGNFYHLAIRLVSDC